MTFLHPSPHPPHCPHRTRARARRRCCCSFFGDGVVLLSIQILLLTVMMVVVMTTTTTMTTNTVNAFIVPTSTTTVNNLNSNRHHRIDLSNKSLHLLKATTTDTTTTTSIDIPRISSTDLQTLSNDGYVVIENFIPQTDKNGSSNLKEALRDDILNLRSKSKFKIAKIGQDTTNKLNEEIRVAETCFLGKEKPELRDVYNQRRDVQLYDLLEFLRLDLEENSASSNNNNGNTIKLDQKLSEFLYAYYPTGGFYRRHRDAVKGSVSYLRQYSLLLYLNTEEYSSDKDGGQLRIHFDSGHDFLPVDEQPNYLDIHANGGTLVLFESSKFPHEVLNTSSERFAIVGWYNRPMSLTDISAISSNKDGSGSGSSSSGGGVNDITGDPVRLIGLAVAAGLVTVGLINILGS
jgi:SM-20-related protein